MKNTMKRIALMFVAALTFGQIFASEITVTNTVDVYNLTLDAKVPYIKNGVRIYSTQSFTGFLYLEYNQYAELSNCYATVRNKKTGVDHSIKFDVENFVRLGKSNKYTDHTVPSVVLVGKEDAEFASGHELIKEIALAGNGTLKTIKVSGCDACGGTDYDYCCIASKLTGRFVGLMDCMCDDETVWNHTVEATRCKDTLVRSHEAAVFGSWTAKWNKKYSDVVKIDED